MCGLCWACVAENEGEFALCVLFDEREAGFAFSLGEREAEFGEFSVEFGAKFFVKCSVLSCFECFLGAKFSSFNAEFVGCVLILMSKICRFDGFGEC